MSSSSSIPPVNNGSNINGSSPVTSSDSAFTTVTNAVSRVGTAVCKGVYSGLKAIDSACLYPTTDSEEEEEEIPSVTVTSTIAAPLYLWSRHADGSITKHELTEPLKAKYEGAFDKLEADLKKLGLPTDATGFAIRDFKTRSASYKDATGTTREFRLSEICQDPKNGIDAQVKELITMYEEVCNKEDLSSWAQREKLDGKIDFDSVDWAARTYSYTKANGDVVNGHPFSSAFSTQYSQRQTYIASLKKIEMPKDTSTLSSGAASGHYSKLAARWKSKMTQEKTEKTVLQKLKLVAYEKTDVDIQLEGKAKWDRKVDSKKDTLEEMLNVKRTAALKGDGLKDPVKQEFSEEKVRERLAKMRGEDPKDLAGTAHKDELEVARNFMIDESPANNYDLDDKTVAQNYKLLVVLEKIIAEEPFILALFDKWSKIFKESRDVTKTINECAKDLGQVYDQMQAEISGGEKPNSKYAEELKAQWVLDRIGFLVPQGTPEFKDFPAKYVQDNPGTLLRGDDFNEIVNVFLEIKDYKYDPAKKIAPSSTLNPTSTLVSPPPLVAPNPTDSTVKVKPPTVILGGDKTSGSVDDDTVSIDSDNSSDDGYDTAEEDL